MKTSSVITTLLAFATAAAAAPSEPRVGLLNMADLDPSDYDTGVVEVTDERFPGRVFSGSLESIYHEMREARPDLIRGITELGTSPSRRDASLSPRDGKVTCRDENRVGSWSFCWEGSIFLEELGDARCTIRGANTRRSLEGRQSRATICGAVSCSRSCYVGFCVNDQNPEHGVRCGDIVKPMQDIANECVTSIGTFGGIIHLGTWGVGITHADC